MESKKYVNETEQKKIQLRILSDIHQYCKLHGLQYWLTYGSLLGAIRHDGFIPWDDDIDIAMPRSDYEVFVRNYTSDDNKVYSLCNNDIYNLPFAKVCDSHTIQKMNVNRKLDMGVYIDIFPVDNIPNSHFLRKIQSYEVAFYLHLLNLKKNKVDGNNRSFINKCVFALAKLPTYFINERFLTKRLNNAMMKYSRDNTNFGACLDEGKCHQIAKPYEIALHKFEDEEYNIPKDYDIWLTMQYGDYLTPPPVSDRQSKHISEIWWKDR